MAETMPAVWLFRLISRDAFAASGNQAQILTSCSRLICKSRFGLEHRLVTASDSKLPRIGVIKRRDGVSSCRSTHSKSRKEHSRVYLTRQCSRILTDGNVVPPTKCTAIGDGYLFLRECLVTTHAHTHTHTYTICKTCRH